MPLKKRKKIREVEILEYYRQRNFSPSVKIDIVDIFYNHSFSF